MGVDIKIRVNALNRASPISTVAQAYSNTAMQSGVNALNRASPISTDSKRNEVREAAVCQCPQSGFPHFYYIKMEAKKIRRYVSMPSIGLPPFLRIIRQ